MLSKMTTKNAWDRVPCGTLGDAQRRIRATAGDMYVHVSRSRSDVRLRTCTLPCASRHDRLDALTMIGVCSPVEERHAHSPLSTSMLPLDPFDSPGYPFACVSTPPRALPRPSRRVLLTYLTVTLAALTMLGVCSPVEERHAHSPLSTSMPPLDPFDSPG